MAEDRISKSDNRLIKNGQLERQTKALRWTDFWNKNQQYQYTCNEISHKERVRQGVENYIWRNNGQNLSKRNGKH